jgi:hypothetical protein
METNQDLEVALEIIKLLREITKNDSATKTPPTQSKTCPTNPVLLVGKPLIKPI